MSKANALTITNLDYNPDEKTYCSVLLNAFFFLSFFQLLDGK